MVSHECVGSTSAFPICHSGLLIIHSCRLFLSYRAAVVAMALLMALCALHLRLRQLAQSHHDGERDVFGWRQYYYD